VVLAYQSWTYYVFRRRVSKRDFEQPAPSAESAEPAPPGTPSTPVGDGRSGAMNA
jgi:hypothetical protein